MRLREAQESIAQVDAAVNNRFGQRVRVPATLIERCAGGRGRDWRGGVRHDSEELRSRAGHITPSSNSFEFFDHTRHGVHLFPMTTATPPPPGSRLTPLEAFEQCPREQPSPPGPPTPGLPTRG